MPWYSKIKTKVRENIKFLDFDFFFGYYKVTLKDREIKIQKYK